MTPGAALVTGAGARLGKAMAEALGQAGWTVGVHYHRSRAGAEDTARMIGDAGSNAIILQADLADEASRNALLHKAADGLGAPVTLLVNSASLFEDDRATTFSGDSWRRHMDTNLRAPLDLTQQLARALPKQEKGLIVNLIDQRVLNLTPEFFSYTLSKAALWTATQTLAQALAPAIRVNAIAPGPTLANIHQSAEEFAAEKRATLTGEGSGPDEIVRALLYLISASSVTGQLITCDGGQHLWRG